MSSLELKDITNLPSSLPYSLIPQGQTGEGVYVQHAMSMNRQGLQEQLALRNSGEVSQQQQRLSINDSGCCELMDDSLTDMQWLQRMDAGKASKLDHLMKPRSLEAVVYIITILCRIGFSWVDACSKAEKACKQGRPSCPQRWLPEEIGILFQQEGFQQTSSLLRLLDRSGHL